MSHAMFMGPGKGRSRCDQAGYQCKLGQQCGAQSKHVSRELWMIEVRARDFDRIGKGLSSIGG